MAQNQPLQLRPLGSTGLLVPPLCIGCAPLGDMPDTFAYSVSEEQAKETMRAIFRSPITFIDTAASYGDGESERRIGLVLKELGGIPEGYVVATKADRDLKTGEFTGEQMRRSVERSLRLLNLERLQLVYLHDPEFVTYDQIMAANGPVEVLLKLKEEGLIEHLGVAGGPIDLMTRYVETGLFEAAISHNRYTLLSTEADAFWDVCQKRGVAAVNAAPYGSGILAKGPRAYPRYQYSEASPDMVEKAIRMEDACRDFQIPLAAVALQFSTSDPRIHSTIVGMSRPQRIEETIELAQYQIPAELWSAIHEIRRGE